MDAPRPAWLGKVLRPARRLDRKTLVLLVLLCVGSLCLVAEGRRARLVWTDLPERVSARAVRERPGDVPAQTPGGGEGGEGGTGTEVRSLPRPGRSSTAEPGTTRPAAPAHPGVLDLNRATARELEALPGIGPTLARRVIAYREANGPFRDIGELQQVSGIGPARLARLSGLVTAGEEPGVTP